VNPHAPFDVKPLHDTPLTRTQLRVWQKVW